MNTLGSEIQEPALDPEADNLVFSYLTLRLVVGIIALLLPVLTPFISSTPLSSISGSYHTEARDIFVGSLFIVGALLLAYNGRPHPPLGRAESMIVRLIRKLLNVDALSEERVVSSIGAVAAIGAALYPTSCDKCVADQKSVIHYIAAVILFFTIAYFCLSVFRTRAKAKAKDKEERNLEAQPGKKQKLRASIYLVSGWGIVACMLGAGAAQLVLTNEIRTALAITYWAETVALFLFGFSWLTASRIIPWLVDKDEQLILWESTSKDKGQELPVSA
jgi:hypothetical protein